MANNRIYLRCSGCGKEFFIAKRFGDSYNTYGFLDTGKLNDFFDEHYYCKDAGPDCFELVYEMPPENCDNDKWFKREGDDADGKA